MKNEELQKRVLEKVQDKIAIFELEREEQKMKKIYKNFSNIAATIVVVIGISIGTVYAGNIIYEKIWKEPTRINLADTEITEEVINKNVSEEEARIVAENKLKQLNFNEDIIDVEQYKISGSDEIEYRFYTENYEVIINGITGEFYRLWVRNVWNDELSNYSMSRDEAINVAKNYYKEFGYEEGEYEFAELVPQWDDGTENSGFFSARFYKKYGELYNTGESICIQFFAKDNQLEFFEIQNKKCDDNPVEITKEQAIQIAKEEDRKVENKPIIKVTAELKIRKMNGKAYARLNNTEEYYKPMTTTNVPVEEIIYYQTEGRIRKVWVVVFEYGEKEDNIVDSIIKGQYSYFVDATTGEIIGGEIDNDLYWENYWFEKNKVIEN